MTPSRVKKVLTISFLISRVLSIGSLRTIDANVPQGLPPRQQVCAGGAADEPACRPGSVHPLSRADGHPSGTAVADSLVRSTREHRAGHPRTLAQSPDRKSTRLNSSHITISYAVFCLKKKKKKLHNHKNVKNKTKNKK